MDSKEGSNYRGTPNEILFQSLRWQQALEDHFYETENDKEREICAAKIASLKAELKRRGVL